MKKLLLGLIGSGIQRSLSPALHEEEGRHHDLRIHYQLIDVSGTDGETRLDGLVSAARLMGFAGFNVTYPYKQAVLPMLDELAEEAREMGAVNTVVRQGDRLLGHNTDGSGWAWGFRRALPDAKLGRVVLLGAGGAGSAIAHAAVGLGVQELLIFDRDADRAAELADALGGNAQATKNLEKAMAQADGLIQATPVGMEKSPGMPLDAKLLRPELWVSEAVYVPLETELLKAARRLGCATMDGGHMNVGQACRAFELFTGEKADSARMEAHFRRLVA
jgi:shikimate dehydrogenase